MDGVELAGRLRERRASLAVVVMTGWDREETPPPPAVVDFTAHKPLGMDALQDLLTRAPFCTRDAARGSCAREDRDAMVAGALLLFGALPAQAQEEGPDTVLALARLDSLAIAEPGRVTGLAWMGADTLAVLVVRDDRVTRPDGPKRGSCCRPARASCCAART